MRDELGQSFALLPWCSDAWIWIAKPLQSGIKKFIRGRSVAAGALSVERPAKYELRRTVVFSSHSSQPMVNERRFSDSAPGSNCNNVDLLVCPGIVQESDVLFTTKKITSCDRQSAYGNLLWTKSRWPLASFDTRSGRGRLLQVPTHDPTWCLDSICDRRYRLQQLVWGLETLCRIFLKEFLKENDDRLWNIFELRKRAREGILVAGVHLWKSEAILSYTMPLTA